MAEPLGPGGATPRVSVIIPNWNGLRLLRPCLDALRRQTVADREVIVVENASTDGSRETLAAEYPEVRVLAQETNLGFAAGCNAGIRAARGRVIALLNNDVEAEPDWLAELLAALERHPRAGAVASRMMSHADRTLLNCYGPTETTIVALMSSLHPGEPITIGRPVAGVSAMVLDHRLRPLPPFAPGELYLTGPGLATGYLNRSSQTARTFVAATDGSGARMYRTGDLAATDLAGNLVFHGRSDHQVKVRGFRIELDEVDAVLTGHPDVGASVTVVDGSCDSARLVSYVTGAADADVDRVRSYAGDQLPRHMVPAVVVPLDTIPLTVNGKVDRAALPVPERAERVPARRPAPGRHRSPGPHRW